LARNSKKNIQKPLRIFLQTALLLAIIASTH